MLLVAVEHPLVVCVINQLVAGDFALVLTALLRAVHWPLRYLGLLSMSR